MKESKVIIHGTGSGTCALTGKDGDGLTVSFDDGTVREAFLSWKGFRQLLGMKSTQRGAIQRPSRQADPDRERGQRHQLIDGQPARSCASPALSEKTAWIPCRL